MPIFTGTVLARSPSTTKTTSIGFGASFDFLSALAVLVPSSAAELAAKAVAEGAFVLPLDVAELVAPEASRFAPGLSLSSVLGKRLVTLAMGTVRTFVR